MSVKNKDAMIALSLRKVIESLRKVIESLRKIIESLRKDIERLRKVIERLRKVIESLRKVIERSLVFWALPHMCGSTHVHMRMGVTTNTRVAPS